MPRRSLRRASALLAAIVMVAMAPGASAQGSGTGQLSFVRRGSVFVMSPDLAAATVYLRTRREPGFRYWYEAPAWSPDGSALAATEYEVPDSPELHGWARLVVVRPGEQPVEPNCDCSYGPEEASWSPDGQRLTFVSGGVYDPDPVGALQITDLSTGQNRYLTRRLDGAPAWSPDGALIAFVRHPSAESVDDIPERARARRLYLIPATGGTPRRVLNIEASHPSWSPDGKHIAFDDGTRIGIVGRNGGTTRFITAGTYPAWSLDGTTIAYMRLNSVWLVQADGRRPHLVAKNASDPAWRPTP